VGRACGEQFVLDRADAAADVEESGLLDTLVLQCVDQRLGRGDRSLFPVLAELRCRELLVVKAPHPTRGRCHGARFSQYAARDVR
jgi:hypothetical protein